MLHLSSKHKQIQLSDATHRYPKFICVQPACSPSLHPWQIRVSCPSSMLLRISKPNLAVVIKRNFTQGLTDASIFSILSPTFERSSLKKFGVGQGSQSLRLNKTKKKQKHQMHHRKSTSDGSQRSPGAPGGSPNLPFLRAYARTARNSEVVISFESSHTWQKDRGAGQERWQTTVSSGVWSICTVHFLPRHVLLSPNQAWLEPANELKEEPLLRPEVCFDFKECMTRSEGFISVGNSPRLSETWCSWSTDEFWNKNLSVKHIAACPDLRPKKPFIFTYKSFVESGARNLQSYYAVIFCHF